MTAASSLYPSQEGIVPQQSSELAKVANDYCLVRDIVSPHQDSASTEAYCGWDRQPATTVYEHSVAPSEISLVFRIIILFVVIVIGWCRKPNYAYCSILRQCSISFRSTDACPTVSCCTTDIFGFTVPPADFYFLRIAPSSFTTTFADFYGHNAVSDGACFAGDFGSQGR
ncbi:hypothetical protein MD484_g5732, partial [Candolleomyces efflorescens]